MQLLKAVAIAIATTGLIFFATPPSHARQGKSTQNVRSTATPALSTNKPYVRPVAADTRDHRKAANPAVKPSGEKRKSSTCVQSFVGGPSVCSGGKVIAGPINPPIATAAKVTRGAKKVGKAAKSVAKKLNPFD
jgi:hypothetical protein